MHDAGPAHAADTRKTFAAMSNQGIHERSGPIAGRRMHHEAARLVDNDNVVVLVDDRKRDVLGVRFGRFDLGPEDPRWSEANDIGPDAHIVIPGTPVWIGSSRQDLTVCDPTCLVRYAGHAAYRPRLLSPSGDHCLYLQFEWAEQNGSRGSAPVDRLPCPPHLHLQVHRLQRLLAANVEPLAADELLLRLAATVESLVRRPGRSTCCTRRSACS